MIGTFGGKPRTLHVLDSLKMVAKVGDTYVSFGKPIKVADHLDMTRKEMSVYAREKCLELVKILPINVVSRAIVEAIRGGGGANMEDIKSNISRIIETLLPLKERFRGFTENDGPDFLLKRAAKYERSFKPKYISSDNLLFYELYANYTGHYFK
jgi:hypothetical protein